MPNRKAFLRMRLASPFPASHLPFPFDTAALKEKRSPLDFHLYSPLSKFS